MKLIRIFIAVLLVAVLGGVAYVEQARESSGIKMTKAATSFLESMSPAQRARISISFDDKERLNWHFIPLQDRQKRSTRKGLPLEAMSDQQKEAARNLLRTGTSREGYSWAITIMGLESILNELEKGRGPVRDPGWYFFTIFGQPSNTGRWGWRVEGHHLSLNFVVEAGKVVSATPAFFGANPATLMSGSDKGKRTLGNADDLARDLFRDLNDEQKKAAHQDKDFAEIETGSSPQVGTPRGLAASQMTDSQRGKLLRLLQAYLERIPPDVAEAQRTALEQAGFEHIHFALAGGLETGQPHSYRLQGPSFLVEFLNVQADSAQNPANHIHSAWREINGDFGIVSSR